VSVAPYFIFHTFLVIPVSISAAAGEIEQMKDAERIPQKVTSRERDSFFIGFRIMARFEWRD
jgi:hypothetical protein